MTGMTKILDHMWQEANGKMQSIRYGLWLCMYRFSDLNVITSHRIVHRATFSFFHRYLTITALLSPQSRSQSCLIICLTVLFPYPVIFRTFSMMVHSFQVRHMLCCILCWQLGPSKETPHLQGRCSFPFLNVLWFNFLLYCKMLTIHTFFHWRLSPTVPNRIVLRLVWHENYDAIASFLRKQLFIDR